MSFRALFILATALPAAVLFWAAPGSAQSRAEPPVQTSACYAFSRDRPPAPPVRLARFGEGLAPEEVAITYVGHSTFLIETPGGEAVATDYAGFAGLEVIPTVVTMNGAHSTHYTDYPDPRIAQVLRGWPRNGAPAHHDLTIGDLRIRNVTTDVIRFGGERIPDGNSIFVFEINDLCIGHLGHLHHVPSPEQFGRIGFLDIVMAPVDGVYTIDQARMIEILTALRARVVIPMHYFGPATLARFVAGIQSHFEVQTAGSRIVVSDRALPRKSTVLVMPPMQAFSTDN